MSVIVLLLLLLLALGLAPLPLVAFLLVSLLFGIGSFMMIPSGF